MAGTVGKGMGAPVLGAPYSATVKNESVQTLADGNRIVQKTTSSVARDAEGRTRREQALGFVGPLLGARGSERMVFINDPVAGQSYMLDMEGKTAVRHTPPQVVHGSGPGEAADMIVTHAGPNLGFKRMLKGGLPEGRTKPLGKRVVEGIEAEGTQTTMTIPAGEIGNELPIEIVSERWFSPELQLLVMSRHYDPRFGETTYRLSHLTRGDPPASLFEVPPDFSVQDGPEAGKVIQLHREMRTPREPR